MTAHADEKGDVRIAGIFDADLTEFLPMSWAVATAGACEYDPSTNVRLPTSHTGVVSARHPHPGASSPRDAGAVEVRGGDVAECRIGGFGPLVNPVGR